MTSEERRVEEAHDEALSWGLTQWRAHLLLFELALTKDERLAELKTK
jgi:hypothetical protein